MSPRVAEQFTQAATATAQRPQGALHAPDRPIELGRRGLCIQCDWPVDRHFQRGTNRFRGCAELSRTLGA